MVEFIDLEFGAHGFLINHVYLPTEQAETNICWIIYQNATFKICLCLFGWKVNILTKMHIVQCSQQWQLTSKVTTLPYVKSLNFENVRYCIVLCFIGTLQRKTAKFTSCNILAEFEGFKVQNKASPAVSRVTMWAYNYMPSFWSHIQSSIYNLYAGIVLSPNQLASHVLKIRYLLASKHWFHDTHPSKWVWLWGQEKCHNLDQNV